MCIRMGGYKGLPFYPHTQEAALEEHVRQLEQLIGKFFLENEFYE